MADGAVDLSRIGVALGTAAYMSPEQVRGEKLDTRTDLFSFGLVLYEMATGRRAFSTENATALRQALLNSIPIPVHDLNPHLPLKLEEIVNKCLEKDRNLRYRNVAELREDLRRMKDDVAGHSSGEKVDTATSSQSTDHGSGSSITHRSVIEPSTRWSKKRVGSALIVGLLILIAGAYGTYTFWRVREKRPFQSMKIERLSNSGKVRVGAISADGRYVMYAQDEGNGQQSLRLRHMATGSDAQVMAPGTLTYSQLDFSPDGDFLYFISPRPENAGVGDLYRIPVLGGQPHQLIKDVDYGVSFSPDGKKIAFVRGDPVAGSSRVMVANSDGTGERVLASLVGRQYVGVAWSPDGKWIAAITASGTGRASDAILLNPLNGAAKTIYSGHSISLFNLGWTGDSRHLVANFTEPSIDQLQIGEISISDGRLRRITNDLSDYGGLSVTKDGKQLATTQTVIDRGLYIMSAAPDDASNPPAIDDRIYEAHWLPDGRLLAVDNFYRVITMSAAGSNQTVIFQDNFVVGRLSVCPDGRHALFSALDKETGNLNIGRLDIQSSDATMLTSDEFDVTPVCSPDGTYFVYSSRAGGKWRLMKKPLAGGPATQLSEKQIAFPAISPDGSQIAAVALEGSAANEVEMIEIFSPQGGTPLKSFAPGPTFSPGGDRYGLQFSADEQAIYYVTSSKGVDNIVMQPMSGGPPTPVTKFRDKFITAFDFDWRNERLAVVRGTSRSDIVLITQQEGH
jgi:eukaryotic-like serine/threonine-protein kinase